MNKKELRKRYLVLRESLSRSEIEDKSRCIMDRLVNTEWFDRAKSVMTYLSMRGEVDTWKLAHMILESGKKLVIPVTDLKEKKLWLSQVNNLQEELEVKTYGIMEPKDEYVRPVDKNALDLIIVPGVVFDEQGYRIGYGGGFYDRLLKDLNSQIKTIGVAYDYQVLESLVPDTYDQKVNMVITEERTIII